MEIRGVIKDHKDVQSFTGAVGGLGPLRVRQEGLPREQSSSLGPGGEGEGLPGGRNSTGNGQGGVGVSCEALASQALEQVRKLGGHERARGPNSPFCRWPN